MNSPIQTQNITSFNEVSVDENQTAESIDIKETPLYSVQLKSTDISGTVTVYTEASNILVNATDEDYVAIDTYILPAGDSKRLLNVEKAGYALVRLRIEQTTGDGTLTATVNTKSL